MAAVDEDEWEYEYEGNESEDFYVTVDLSGVPDTMDPSDPSLPHQPILANEPSELRRPLRKSYDNTEEAMETTTEAADESLSGPIGEVQITGLHTSNPLMMVNGQLLSCYWGSTIGTELLFARPTDKEDFQTHPLRSLPSVDLVSLGSAKLMAKAARLRPRDEILEKFQGDEDSASRAGGLVTEEKAPSNFLARFNEAKARRGDRTKLIVNNDSNGPRLVSRQNVSASDKQDSPSDMIIDPTPDQASDTPMGNADG